MSQNIFENAVEILNPLYAEGRLQVALQPIGPASLGDLQFLVKKGEYGGAATGYLAPHIATFPELIAFLSQIKKTDEDVFHKVVGLSEESSVSSGLDAKVIKAIVGDSDTARSFGMREAAYEGAGSGLCIAGNTVLFAEGTEFVVKDDPMIQFDNYNGALIPESLYNFKAEDFERTDGRIKFTRRHVSKQTRVLSPLGNEDLNGGSDVLTALIGSRESADRVMELDPLTTSPLLSDFYDCTQPRTCVATLRQKQDASVYVGGYSDEGREKYSFFLARHAIIR